MAPDKHLPSFFHPRKEEKPAPEMTKEDSEKEVKHHKNLEHVCKLGTAAALAIAHHEKQQAKKDPENAKSHKIKEEIARAVAVGTVAIGRHEHHEKKEAKKEKKAAFGKKPHLF